MTTIVTVGAAATGNRTLLTTALAYWLVRLEDTALNEISTIDHQANGCRSPL